MNSRLIIFTFIFVFVAAASTQPVSAAVVLNAHNVTEQAEALWTTPAGIHVSVAVLNYGGTQTFLLYEVAILVPCCQVIEKGRGLIPKGDFKGNIQTQMTLSTNTSASANPAYIRDEGAGGIITFQWQGGPVSTEYSGKQRTTWSHGVTTITGNYTTRVASIQGTVLGVQPEGTIWSAVMIQGHQMNHLIEEP